MGNILNTSYVPRIQFLKGGEINMTLEEIQKRFAERDHDFSQVSNRDLAFKEH